MIYGSDDRRDLFEVDDPLLAQIAFESTAAAVPPALLSSRPDGTLRLQAPTLIESFGVCSDEPFAEEPSAAQCSAVLVAPDLLLTAGHCGKRGCEHQTWLFGYALGDPKELPTFLPTDVYRCRSIESIGPTGPNDHGFVRLDRPVANRQAVPLAASGASISPGARLAVIGYPAGLPVKVHSAALVLDAGEQFLELASDTFSGSSGLAPVFNGARSGRLAVWICAGRMNEVAAHTELWLADARALGDRFGELVVELMGSMGSLALDDPAAARRKIRNDGSERSRRGFDPSTSR